MKRTLLTLCLFLSAASALPAQDPTAADRDKAVAYLEKTRTAILDATKGLSERQWNFKPATNRWSVAEVAEHIAAAEDLLRELIRTNVMKAPGRTNTVDVKALDDLVLAQVPDRTTRFQAPEPLQPVNRFKSPDESVKHFTVSREATIQYLKTTPGLRAHALDSPVGRPLDGFQWLLFIGAHSERHTKQLQEVKDDPGFPKQ